jgi:hypothetical protein
MYLAKGYDRNGHNKSGFNSKGYNQEGHFDQGKQIDFEECKADCISCFESTLSVGFASRPKTVY